MSAGFDFTKLGEAAKEEQAAHDATVYKRTARLTNRFGGRLMLDENDLIASAVEMLLGCKQGGIEGAAELLKLSPTPANGPRELTDGSNAVPDGATPDRPLPVYNSDNSNAGVGLREAQAIQAGYGYKFDAEGKHIGWQKPPADAHQATAPNQATDKVPVHGKDDKPSGRMVTIQEGNADKKLEAMPDSDGTVMYYRVKTRFTRS